MNKLRFWCQKVLPLVYDDSLSYYELLCKVVKYINDIIDNIKIMSDDIEQLRKDFEALKNYVDNYFSNLDLQEEVNKVFEDLIESGKINELLRNALISDLVETSMFSPFAQVLSEEQRTWDYTKYQQGFSIGIIDGRPVCCNCFTDNTPEGATNVIVFTYLDTGDNIGRFTIPSGHCNSCTFNSTTGTFFIATGGGNSTLNTVLEVGTDGTLKNTYTLESSPWAIAWNKDKFYVTLPAGVLLETDNEFNILNRYNIVFNKDYVHQGMFADDLYLYYPCGNTRTISNEQNRNMFEIYYHDGTFYKIIEVYFPLEMEECDLYNNECYLASNTQGVGFICITDLYKSTVKGYLGGWYLPNNNNNIFNMYIDETYNGFFMDGEENTPYSSLTWWYFLVPTGITELKIYLLSDITAHPFSTFTPFNYSVSINGNNHKLLRVNWNSNNQLVLKDLIIIGQNNSTFVNVESVRFIANNLTIGESGTKIIANRALEVKGSYELSNLTINCNTNGSTALLYIIGDGYIRPFKINSTVVGYALFAGVLDVDGNFPLNKLNNSNYYGITYKVNFTLNEDLDLSKLLFPCTLSVKNNTVHFTNAPEGFDDTNINAIICEYISTNKSLVTIIKTDGTIHQQYNYSPLS